jgi:hypothetical protein
MFRASFFRATGALIALMAMASCNGNETTAPPSQSIGIAVSSAQVTVMCGTSAITTVTLTRGGEFAGVIDLSVSGLPNGVSAFLSPSELTGDATGVTITMVAEETVLPGAYTITVAATSSVGEASVTYGLVVIDPPHFHLGAEPVMTVAAGRIGWTAVYIERRGNFSGAVTLSAVIPTSGITATFDPAIVTGTTGYMTLQVASTVPNGTYTVTVVGEADGVPTTTTKISLTVRSVVTDWYLVADPSELTVVRGGTVRTEVWVVTEDLFPGWATYSLIDPPAGVFADYEYHYDGWYPATAMIHVPSTVTAGRYVLTMGVSFPGFETKTVPIGLTVKDP